ncbi:MFS transporter [Propionibacterium sp.]|uniref:MFS transporter n=1 Tax=Propionibacterium sp. TaxID=1977903 RepID=UPI0039EA150F
MSSSETPDDPPEEGHGKGPHPEPAERAESRIRTFTLVAMCLAQFMIMLDVTIVNIALPSMQRELHLDNSGLEWIISAYALSLAALIPFGGALGDRYGRKRWFLIGLVVFTIGSIGCALSTSSTALVLCRAVQGLGGALMVTLTLSIVTLAFPPTRRAKAIGVWGSLGGLGFGMGPLAGGLLLSRFSWEAVFWVNVPIGLVTLYFTLRFVRESPRVFEGSLDVPGLVLTGLGLVGIAYGLITASSHSWTYPVVLPSLIVGILLLFVFVRWERVAPSPMMPLGLFRSLGFVTGIFAYFFNFLALTGGMFYMTLMYQNVKGWAVLPTGLTWLFMNIPFVVSAQYADWLNRRLPAAGIITIGAVIEALGTLLLSMVTAGTPLPLTLAGFFCLGLGPGIMIPTATHLAMSDAPAAFAGSASSVLNASRQIGSSVGLAVLGAIGALVTGRHWASTVGGMPDEVQAEASSLLPSVVGGRISNVGSVLGDSARGAAVDAFTAGSHVALLVATACMVVCTLIALHALRRRRV